MLLAILILVLLASILVPTFSGNERRRAQLALDELQDIMSAYAYRDALGGQPIALWRDPEDGSVALLVLERDETVPDAVAEWTIDRLTRPVHLSDELEIVEVLIDQRREALFDWMISRVAGQPRPWIEIDLAGPDDMSVTLLISPTSLTATRIEAGRSSAPVRQPIDLDSIGADRERW